MKGRTMDREMCPYCHEVMVERPLQSTTTDTTKYFKCWTDNKLFYVVEPNTATEAPRLVEMWRNVT